MKHLENDRVKFFQGDQGNRENLLNMYSVFGNKPFDFILEDGSHFHHHQMISFGALFKYVKSGGYYILEDITEEGIDACCQRNDETYKVIFNLKETGKIENEHLLEEEIKYIENKTKMCTLNTLSPNLHKLLNLKSNSNPNPINLNKENFSPNT